VTGQNQMLTDPVVDPIGSRSDRLFEPRRQLSTSGRLPVALQGRPSASRPRPIVINARAVSRVPKVCLSPNENPAPNGRGLGNPLICRGGMRARAPLRQTHGRAKSSSRNPCFQGGQRRAGDFGRERREISAEKDGNLRMVYARIGRCQGRPAWRGASAAVARPYPAVTCHVGGKGGPLLFEPPAGGHRYTSRAALP
jgi:hypothetical protein